MKKALMILLGIAVVFSMAGVVVAAEEGGQGPIVLSNNPHDVGQKTDTISIGVPGTVSVYFDLMDETYSVYIPHDVSFSQYQTNVITSNVTAEKVAIKGTDVLFINVSSQYGFKMMQYMDASSTLLQVTSESKNITYSMAYKNPSMNEERTMDSTNSAPGQSIVLMTVNTGTTKAVTTLKFTKTSIAPELGKYIDTLTFTVESKPISNA